MCNRPAGSVHALISWWMPWASIITGSSSPKAWGMRMMVFMALPWSPLVGAR
jgi:hypothetical protein